MLLLLLLPVPPLLLLLLLGLLVLLVLALPWGPALRNLEAMGADVAAPGGGSSPRSLV